MNEIYRQTMMMVKLGLAIFFITGVISSFFNTILGAFGIWNIIGSLYLLIMLFLSPLLSVIVGGIQGWMSNDHDSALKAGLISGFFGYNIFNISMAFITSIFSGEIISTFGAIMSESWIFMIILSLATSMICGISSLITSYFSERMDIIKGSQESEKDRRSYSIKLDKTHQKSSDKEKDVGLESESSDYKTSDDRSGLG